MKAILFQTISLAAGMMFLIEASGQTVTRDLYSDTWVGVDALGRKMPGVELVGAPKGDHRRTVGIFYITWHDDGKFNLSAPYAGDVSRVLSTNAEARLDGGNVLWKESSYHWGEPEDGYFLSRDEYVIRKDMSMLADAGVDVLILDVTNAVRYWEEWETLFAVMQRVKAEGNVVPKFCFWAYNGDVITVVQDLYERVYKLNKWRDLWFYWDGRPLLLYNSRPALDANGGGVKNINRNYEAVAVTDVTHPHYGDPDYVEEFYNDYTSEVKAFFTLRNMWWGYYEWGGARYVGTEDNWSFGYDLGDARVRNLPPDSLVAVHHGQREEAAVTPAQHPISITGKSWTRSKGEPALNDMDMPTSAYIPRLGREVKNPVAHGLYFQERWEEALASDPEFLYLNDWNEWTAGKYLSGKSPDGKNDGPVTFLGRASNFYFVDQYNAEFNRTIQPMRGGYSDNYYMQMAANIRRYKGVRSVPEYRGFSKISVDGNFDDWEQVAGKFFDTRGDVAHRDYNGYGGLHYTNTSGRNDLLAAKVAVDGKKVYFYIETDSALSPHTDANWMLLLLDVDHDNSTGWHGYDYVVNKKVKGGRRTTLMKYVSDELAWKEVAELDYCYSGNKLEVGIPLKALGLSSDEFTFDYKWSDNPSDLEDIISLCLSGDTAPNRRFAYRYIWRR